MEKNKYLWKTKSGEIISCDEKLKVLNENFNELENAFKNALDDAVLIGCDEYDFKLKFFRVIRAIKSSFSK